MVIIRDTALERLFERLELEFSCENLPIFEFCRNQNLSAYSDRSQFLPELDKIHPICRKFYEGYSGVLYVALHAAHSRKREIFNYLQIYHSEIQERMTLYSPLTESQVTLFMLMVS